jgi:hypothetical protein
MTLVQAKQLIQRGTEQMQARYQKVVFDEWAIISLVDNKGRILAYTGPRKEDFKANFPRDVGPLRAGMLDQQHAAGEFEFFRQGAGTGFEAFMVIGRGLYLICNNTAQSMDVIAKDPFWLAAQVPFVELSDQFRADPVVLGESAETTYYFNNPTYKKTP